MDVIWQGVPRHPSILEARTWVWVYMISMGKMYPHWQLTRSNHYFTDTQGLDIMRAVVFKGVKEVAVEDRPKPSIKDAADIIVKVQYSALCGR